VASVVVSGLGAWWLATQRQPRGSNRTGAPGHGEVIFRNTPIASDTEALI
jgi:hypothetical protein